jgi:DNA primase
MTKTNWIDIEGLKTRLDFAKILRHYGVELKLKGDQHHGFCPLPSHNGKKNSPSFSANLKRGIWQCFGCGEKGNVLDFAVLMEKGNPKNGEDVRRVASKLMEMFPSELRLEAIS